jgi:putative spermidine/putrescine transport system substrate-binding protein
MKLGVAGSAAAMAATLGSRSRVFAQEMDMPDISGMEIVSPGYGGTFDDAVREFVDPLWFEMTGVPVTIVSGPDASKLVAMVENDAVEWDMFPTGPEFPPSIYDDPNPIFEPIDYSIVQADPIPKDLQFKHMITTDGYALGIVWRADTFDEGPQSWADFWDTEKFPGPRTLPRRAADIIEIAAMADGIPEGDPNFYPIDVDRAIASIERIQPDVVKFWTGGEEPMQLLLSGEVDLAGVWLSRVFAPMDEGAPIDMTWNQNIFRIGGFSPVRLSKNLPAVMKYLDFRTKPETQALISNAAPIAYSNPDTAQHIDPEQVRLLPSSPENAAVQHLSNGQFWFDNEAEINERLTDVLGA